MRQTYIYIYIYIYIRILLSNVCVLVVLLILSSSEACPNRIEELGTSLLFGPLLIYMVFVRKFSC